MSNYENNNEDYYQKGEFDAEMEMDRELLIEERWLLAIKLVLISATTIAMSLIIWLLW